MRTALPESLKGPKILNLADRHVSFNILCTCVGGTERTTACYGVSHKIAVGISNRLVDRFMCLRSNWISQRMLCGNVVNN